MAQVARGTTLAAESGQGVSVLRDDNSCNGIPLHQITKGTTLVVIDIPEGRSRERLIRLGILKGQVIKCIERLPGGTVVIEKNRQEIAIGAALAKTILVAYTSADGKRQD